MSLERKTAWWLRTDAILSWLLALPGLFDPAGVATLFGAEEPAYSFLVRMWSGLLFVFGWASWEAGANLRAKAPSLKFIWIQKTVVAVSVLVGHLSGEAPPSLMALVLLTNLPWILALGYFDVRLRGAARTTAASCS